MQISAAGTWRAVVVLVAAVATATLVPDPAAWRALTAPRAGAVVRVDDLAVLLAGGALWLLAVWVLGVAALAALASLPGYGGRLGRRLVRAAVPRVLRGIVLGGIAGGLVLGPTVAATALPVRPTGPPTVAASAVATPGPAWPTTPPASGTSGPTGTDAGTATGTPGPGWPTSPPAGADPTDPTPSGSGPADSPPSDSTPTDPRPADTGPTDHPPADTPPVRPPAVPTSPSSPTSTPTGTTGTTGSAGPTAVVVAPGDSLWSITASALTAASGAAPTDRQVAAAWPTWFAVNREVIGPDPGLLQPGTHLTPPTTDGSTP